MATDGWRAWRISVAAGVLAAAWGGWYVFARGPHDEFATLHGHRDGIFSMVVAPGGAAAASGGGDGAVRVWNLANYRQQVVLSGSTGRVTGLAWSPDGEQIATAGADKSIRLWNAKSGTEATVWATLRKPVRGLAFSSDGTTLAAAVDLQIYSWNLNNRYEPRIWNAHRLPIAGMAFLPGRLELVTFAGDQTVRFWNLETAQEIARLPGPIGHCYGMALSADGRTIACVGGGRVHLYDAQARRPLEVIEPNAHILCGAAFSPDGRTLAIGSQDKAVLVWDIPGKKELARLSGHDFAVGPMAFLADGKTLLTSSHDSTLKLWKVK